MPNLIHCLLAVLLAPGFLGIINKTKAFFAGRTGQALYQPYLDLWKLLKKGTVYSRTTSFCFQMAPLVGLAAVLVALLMMPAGGQPGALHFAGDLILFAYVLGLMRFFLVAAALDTGSSFEGMGASREVQFSALAEPAFFLVLATLASLTGELSLTDIFSKLSYGTWNGAFPALILVVTSLLVILLTESGRVPVDDPTTHLELTMIHEAMILDYAGPDFAFILYSAALKLWLLGSLILGILLPHPTANPWINGLLFLGGMGILAIAIGVIESTKARLQLRRVPKFIGSAAVLSALALLLVVR